MEWKSHVDCVNFVESGLYQNQFFRIIHMGFAEIINLIVILSKEMPFQTVIVHWIAISKVQISQKINLFKLFFTPNLENFGSKSFSRGHWPSFLQSFWLKTPIFFVKSCQSWVFVFFHTFFDLFCEKLCTAWKNVGCTARRLWVPYPYSVSRQIN